MFINAMESFRYARETLIAVMRNCQEENTRIGARGDDIAIRYQISLEAGEALARPGPLPHFDDAYLRSDVLLAQFICDLFMQDADEVLRADIVTIDSVIIMCGFGINPQTLLEWRGRAQLLGVELHWQVADFSKEEVERLKGRLARGDAGPPLSVARSVIERHPTVHARLTVRGSSDDILPWTQGASWPQWATLEGEEPSSLR